MALTLVPAGEYDEPISEAAVMRAVATTTVATASFSAPYVTLNLPVVSDILYRLLIH